MPRARQRPTVYCSDGTAVKWASGLARATPETNRGRARRTFADEERLPICCTMRSITLFVGALVGTASAQTEGDVKLVNGRTAGGYDGLLQVYYKGAWSSVCSGLGAYGSGSYFEDSHATLVCKQLFNTDWVSWTVDEGHCYTPLTGGGIVELEDPYVYDYSTYTYTATTYTTFLEAVDGRSGGPSACTHDEDVSIVCGFDGSESSTDASLDLSCVPGNCSPGYKECSSGYNYYPTCCGGDFPDCDQYGYCTRLSRTAWKSPSGLGYPDDYCGDLHAIEQMHLRTQRRVDGAGPKSLVSTQGRRRRRRRRLDMYALFYFYWNVGRHRRVAFNIHLRLLLQLPRLPGVPLRPEGRRGRGRVPRGAAPGGAAPRRRGSRAERPPRDTPRSVDAPSSCCSVPLALLPRAGTPPTPISRSSCTFDPQ